MTNNQSQELLPCPFCGQTPKEFGGGLSQECYSIHCVCGCYLENWERSILIKKWNTRHIPTPPLPDALPFIVWARNNGLGYICNDDLRKLVSYCLKGGDVQMTPQYGHARSKGLTSPEQQQPSRGEIKAILVKCFEHLGKEIGRKSLNESAKDGTQSLSWGIAKILDKL